MMNLNEHLFVVAGEEATEVASAALDLTHELNKAALDLSKVFSKVLRFGTKGVYQLTQQTTINELIGELNDLEAVVEMIIEAGIELPGLHDRKAIDNKKEKVRYYMKEAVNNRTLDL